MSLLMRCSAAGPVNTRERFACGKATLRAFDSQTWRPTRRALVAGLALAFVGPLKTRAEADPATDTPKVIEFSPENKHLLYEAIELNVLPPSGVCHQRL
jgi:hypothetical protein